MTKVLIVAPSAYPLGGVATWIDYMVPGLLARGWEVTVGLTAGKYHNVSAYLSEHPGLPHIEVSNPTGTREGRVRALMRAITATRSQLVIGVNIADTYEAVNRVRLADRSLDVRCLMTIHGIQPDYFEDAQRECRLLDGIVCTNRLAVELAQRAGVAPERLHYAQYGVPLLPNPTSLERDHDRGILRIAYVGRFEAWQKRVFDLRPICDGLVEHGIPFELFLAGAGPDELALRDTLRDHTDAGRVRWLGSLPANEVGIKVYAHVDVLINPSLWETGPIVVWEAMAHGVAVASSRYVGSGREASLVDDENCVLYDLGDTTAAINCVAALTDRPRRARLVRAGLELLRARYSLEASVMAWEIAIQRTIAQPVLPVSTTRTTVSSGRLDRMFGVRSAELFRTVLRRRFEHAEPGGEWPHSYGGRRFDEAVFWGQATAMDRGATVFVS